MDNIKILLVEDHQIVREGLRRMLELEPDMQVVGEASNGEEALAMVDEVTPDIVIADVKMPRIDGVQLTRRLKEDYPQCQVLMLTFYPEFFSEALAAGAVGYLAKDLRREDLIDAIHTVQEGRSPLHLTMERTDLDEVVTGSGTPPLSEREQSILRLVAAGVSIKEIAEQLAFSESTVKRILRATLEKMGARNRSEAVAEAVRRKLI